MDNAIMFDGIVKSLSLKITSFIEWVPFVLHKSQQRTLGICREGWTRTTKLMMILTYVRTGRFTLHNNASPRIFICAESLPPRPRPILMVCVERVERCW